MTLQQMEYIVAVDKYRHFAKAADSCGVSQSTLSSLVQKLETELDVIIFDRSSHPVRPTAVGEEIISRVRRVLFNAAQVRELVATRKGESVGNVSLGIISTVAPYLLPKMFKYLSDYHPDIRLHVEEARVSTLVSKLERGEIDIALMATPVNNSELLEIPVFRERLIAYVSRNRPSTMTAFCRQVIFPQTASGCSVKAIVPIEVFSLSATIPVEYIPYMKPEVLRHSSK